MSQNRKRARFVALRLLIALCQLALSLPTTAQQSGLSLSRDSDASSKNASGTRNLIKLHKYVDPGGAFQFMYSDRLVRCPADSCNAYFPMCENGSGESATLSCFAYEKSGIKDRPAFEAGTFSVAELKDLTTQEECGSLPEGEFFNARRKSVTVILNGVNFKQFELDEGMMSQGLERQLYRNFHDGKCYELNVKIAAISPGVLEPGAGKEFSERDRKVVRDRLEQPLYSFKFLK